MLTLLILSGLLTACGSKEIAVGKPAFITATSLNCRDQAGTFGKITGNFKQSDKVRVNQKSTKKETIDGKENYWYLVENGKSIGWVFGGYLSRNLYDNSKELYGNYYMKFSDEPETVFGNVILSIADNKTYTLFYFTPGNDQKVVDEQGVFELLDDSVVLRPLKRISRMYLVQNNSPYDSYGSYGNSSEPEEINYTKEGSENNKYQYYIRFYQGKILLVSEPVPPYEVANEPSYLLKK